MTVSSGNCNPQDALHCHRVAAITPVVEKTTSALPLSIIESRGMNIILALERCFKASKLDALWLRCVALGFCDFVDHARVHGLHSP